MHNKYYVFLMMATFACGSSVDGYGTSPPVTQPPATWKAKLQKAPLDAVVEGPTSSLSVAATHGGASGAMTLPVLGGDALLQADAAGAITLDSLVVPLGDVVIAPSAMLPGGLHLTDVQISLAAPIASADTTWTDDDDARATVTADLLLDWSDVGTNGTIVPLATVKIPAVPVTIDLANGAVTLDVAKDGVFWDWAGLAKLSDLAATLDARL